MQTITKIILIAMLSNLQVDPSLIIQEDGFVVNSVLQAQYQIPTIDTSFKAYMDYRTITNSASKQYELQQHAYTDEYGFRKIGDLYMVAVGTYYAKECGKVFFVEFDTGEWIYVVVGDIKANVHTNSTNQFSFAGNSKELGNLLEFIVDTDVLSSDAKFQGDVSVAFPEPILGSVSCITELILEVESI